MQLSDEEIIRGNAAAAKQLSEVAQREIARIKALGLPIQPHTTHAAFLNLPGNISDVDLKIPHTGNLEHISSVLSKNGIPFRRMHGANAVHSYTTPDGIWIDVSIRPQKELDYLKRGLQKLDKLTPEEKKRLLLEKFKIHATGDAEAYKQWKQNFYESHGIIPPGGDWSKVAALRQQHAKRSGPDKLKIKTVDGTKIRDTVDKDFTMGGNPSRYSYIPKDEMWVEKNLDPKDRVSTVVHEAIEHRRMKNKGMSYDKAHDEANKSDKKVRKMYELDKFAAYVRQAR